MEPMNGNSMKQSERDFDEGDRNEVDKNNQVVAEELMNGSCDEPPSKRSCPQQSAPECNDRNKNMLQEPVDNGKRSKNEKEIIKESRGTTTSDQDCSNGKGQSKMESSLNRTGAAHTAQDLNKAAEMGMVKFPTSDHRVGKRFYILDIRQRCPVNIIRKYVQKALHGRPCCVYEKTKTEPVQYSCIGQVVIKKSIRRGLILSVAMKLVVLEERQKCDGTIEIEDDEDCIVLGKGVGSSKQDASMAAAKEGLKILLPELHFDSKNTASILDS